MLARYRLRLLWFCVRLPVRHKSRLHKVGWTDGLIFCIQAAVCLSYILLEGIVHLQKWGHFSLNLVPYKYRHGTSTIASVVDLVWPTIVASLWHCASTPVYNRMGVTQRASQLRLGLVSAYARACLQYPSNHRRN